MKVEVIVPAAGSGIRFGGDIAKTLIHLAGKPLVLHCLDVFEKSPSVSSVILAADARHLKQLETMIRDHRLKKVKAIVAGGKTRRESIENALKVLDANTKIVMVHDAARPLITVDLLEAAIADCVTSGANVIAVPVVSTIKEVDPQTRVIRKTLERSLLWEIQTPQTFKKEILLEAYVKRGSFEPTDDASLVEKLGHPVKIMEGSRRNIKVTTPEDLILAEALLKQK